MNDFITVAASTVFFSIVFYIIYPRFSLVSGYYRLPSKKRQEWDSRTTSTLHAVIVGILAVIVVFRTKSGTNLTWLEDPLSTFNVAFSCGYLITDVIAMGIYYNEIGGTVGYMTHHIISIYAYLLCITQGYLSYYANFRIISEASTPLLNFRWKLYVTGHEKSSLYFWNGMALLLIFFICRIIPIPIFWASIYQLQKTEIYLTSVGPIVHYLWLGVCLILDVLNLYWFTLLCKRSFQFLRVKTKI